MSLQAADVKAIADAQHAAPKLDTSVHAVALKLPPFWLTHPAIWFAQVEGQFATCQPSIDLTKYNYIVAALDNVAAGEEQALIPSSSATNKYMYSAFKEALIKAFGKMQAQKDELLSLASAIGSPLPYSDMSVRSTLTRRLCYEPFFVPTSSRSLPILAVSSKTDLDELATDADCIMKVPLDTGNSFEIFGVENTYRRPPQSPTATPLCYYHTKFAKTARKCHQKEYPFGILLQALVTKKLK